MPRKDTQNFIDVNTQNLSDFNSQLIEKKDEKSSLKLSSATASSRPSNRAGSNSDVEEISSEEFVQSVKESQRTVKYQTSRLADLQTAVDIVARDIKKNGGKLFHAALSDERAEIKQRQSNSKDQNLNLKLPKIKLTHRQEQQQKQHQRPINKRAYPPTQQKQPVVSRIKIPYELIPFKSLREPPLLILLIKFLFRRFSMSYNCICEQHVSSIASLERSGILLKQLQS